MFDTFGGRGICNYDEGNKNKWNRKTIKNKI